MVVVAPGDTHRSLRLPVAAQRDSTRHPDVGECSVMIIVIQMIRRSIVGNEQVGPAIVVVIAPDHAQAVIAVRIIHPSFLRNFLERTVAPVVKKQVSFPLHAPGAALHWHSFEIAELGAARHRQIIHIHVYVAGDE